MQNTTVQELINLLSKYNPELPVIISDGFDYAFYSGVYTVQEFVNYEGVLCCDICVGGTKE